MYSGLTRKQVKGTMQLEDLIYIFTKDIRRFIEHLGKSLIFGHQEIIVYIRHCKKHQEIAEMGQM